MGTLNNVLHYRRWCAGWCWSQFRRWLGRPDRWNRIVYVRLHPESHCGRRWRLWARRRWGRRKFRLSNLCRTDGAGPGPGSGTCHLGHDDNRSGRHRHAPATPAERHGAVASRCLSRSIRHHGSRRLKDRRLCRFKAPKHSRKRTHDEHPAAPIALMPACGFRFPESCSRSTNPEITNLNGETGKKNRRRNLQSGLASVAGERDQTSSDISSSNVLPLAKRRPSVSTNPS